ncbi:DoxX family protein [Pseudactinotalea suaedae]|uniref:DoxX family protein n=1 Tax=Pseudactinotalea suaedae TaxID=1524924 RepID=UPI0012E316E8|nr:DoxX family protein [Pseudactinotalea suaedae]
MSPLRALARPLLASAFILDGVDALRHTEEHARKAQPFAPALAKAGAKVPGLPTDPRTLTRLVGAVQIAAGVLLATGKAPRVAAATLAVITVPTAIVRHPAWASTGAERQEHLGGLLRSAALLGGLIFAAEDREGKPSIGWRYDNWREHREELVQLRDELKAEVKAAKQAA